MVKRRIPSPPPFPGQEPPHDERSQKAPKSEVDVFGTKLNTTLSEERNSQKAPKSHHLIKDYVSNRITPELDSANKKNVTWVPVSSIIFPHTPLVGKIAILAHLKEPRRALVYITCGTRDNNGRDIPSPFKYQFVRLTPKRTTTGTSFRCDSQPKMCVSSKKGLWVAWMEYLVASPTCGQVKGGKMGVLPRDVDRVLADYQTYVMGMERSPSSLRYTGFEQFNVMTPISDEWRRCTSEAPMDSVMVPPPPPPPDDEAEEEEEEEDPDENELEDAPQPWYADEICLEGLDVITPACKEFKLLFTDLTD